MLKYAESTMSDIRKILYTLGKLRSSRADFETKIREIFSSALLMFKKPSEIFIFSFLFSFASKFASFDKEK